jgi:protein-disulfide isomerase
MQKMFAFAVLVGALLAPALVRADELFNDRAQASHVNVSALWHWLTAPKQVAAAEQDFTRIAPAAGEEEAAASEGEGHDEAAAEGEGEHKPKKAKSGKDLTGKPSIPQVVIGGEVVVTKQAQRDQDVSASTPPSLKGPANTSMLEQRATIKTYAHSPTRGPSNARINVVLFEDLSCNQCMPYMAKVDTALQTYASDTRVIFVNAPTLKFQDTNQPAFYGKIAARMGVFWPFRAKLIANPPANDGALFDDLMASGVKMTDARMLMLTDARRFYRELDGDALLAESFRVNKPPVVYVNGIRLGEGGLPLEQLEGVLSYVHQRIELKLGEPPQ